MPFAQSISGRIQNDLPLWWRKPPKDENNSRRSRVNDGSEVLVVEEHVHELSHLQVVYR